MPNYRRCYGAGGTFAFTVCLADRSATTLTDHVDLLRAAFRHGLSGRPVRTRSLCILPDHMHLLWTLPDGDADYPTRLRLIKRAFTDRIGRPVWQPRYWEHTIRDADDHANHVNYIHANPVRHGLVRDMDGWPHSTWHRWKADHGTVWRPPPEGMIMAKVEA